VLWIHKMWQSLRTAQYSFLVQSSTFPPRPPELRTLQSNDIHAMMREPLGMEGDLAILSQLNLLHVMSLRRQCSNNNNTQICKLIDIWKQGGLIKTLLIHGLAQLFSYMVSLKAKNNKVIRRLLKSSSC